MTADFHAVALRACFALLLFVHLAATVEAQSPSATTEPVAWLTSDSASRTVTLRLDVTRPDGSPSAVLNGLRAGGAQVVVPINWTVQWEWRSADSSAAHSLVVMTEREKLPSAGGRPAFDNAMTRMAAVGLPAGQADRTTFTADQAGWYWMLCGVPGHALAGEYIGLRVDPEAREGGVKMVKKVKGEE